ncbi:energy-coupling factor transporter transmembrane protein EcfT [Tersicoccus sp. Bi-70]|uniref:energy-coupling factor transporter transmembrane component T family protein n=1 Tax=Tersicoccus sp. Bi-70 TaxID=1897634 RepID=UPI000975CFE7|nr:energy-coupling factor transporter transmembrane component T [Tersicoccus sp. Bi-70]OMH34361.1 cobalt transporter [Tersicoccus sp. Bi-70]
MTATAAPAGTRPARDRSVLARAHPLAKLAAALVLTVALLATTDPVCAGVALVGELALLPLAGLRLRTLLRRGWPILVAALISGYGTTVLAPPSGSVLLQAGPFALTAGALTAGVGIALRGLALAVPGIMLLATTDPTDLADALAQRLHLPHRFVLGALAAMRLVGLLVQEWSTLTMARRARGVGAGTGRGPARVVSRARAGAGQTVALLVQAIRRAGRLAITMEARGFGTGRRTWARLSTFHPSDALVVAGGVLLAAVAVTAAVLAGTWNPIL